MDMKTAVTASRLGVPVIHKGIEYERISARITRITPEGEKYSLELADYCGSAVVIAPVGEVEVAERAQSGPSGTPVPTKRNEFDDTVGAIHESPEQKG